MKPHPLHLVPLSIGLIAIACNSSVPAPSTPPAATNSIPAATTTTALPAGHPPIDGAPAKLPAGHPPIDMNSQTLPAETLGQAKNPQWTVPADWKAGRQSAMRRGSFLVSGADGQSAEIAITVFPGDVGGPLANVNRWRGQIGLEPVTVEQVKTMTTTVDANGIPATIVDFTNPKPPTGKTAAQRMIVATVPHAGDSWFVKMTGDEPVVAAQKDAFHKFVASIKF
jgi:hypothetical protein